VSLALMGRSALPGSRPAGDAATDGGHATALTAGPPMSRYEGFVNAKFFEEQRREMVAAIRAIAEHMAPEIKTALDERVLRAMAKVPRHEFVPVEVQQYPYLNRPIPIGFDKTISQPMMVAVITDLLELKPDDMVLEIADDVNRNPLKPNPFHRRRRDAPYATDGKGEISSSINLVLTMVSKQ